MTDHAHSSGPTGLDLGAPIAHHSQQHQHDNVHITTTTHITPVQAQVIPTQNRTTFDTQASQIPSYTVPLAGEATMSTTGTTTALPARPTATRRQTPRPLITRTPSSYLTHPPSPAHPTSGAQFLKSQRERESDEHNSVIMSGTAVQPDYEADVRVRSRDKGFVSSTPVKNSWERSEGSGGAGMAQPASNLQGHSASDPLSTHDQTNVLPTSRTTHPEAQRQALQETQGGREKDEVVGREMEKAEGDRRALRGDDVGGKIVEGIEDDQLYALLRRFDQDVTHTLLLTSIRPLPLSQPDLRRSVLPNVPYSTDILKSNLERLYASGGTGVTRGVGELMRLRSWEGREKKRTAWFAGTYALAWVLGLAIPTLVGFLIVLVVSPESRLIFFPPVPPPPGQPPSAFDPTNRKGDQTFLGGTDSALTHKSVSEQKEEAAWEFRNLAETFAVKLAVSSGKSPAQGNAVLGEKMPGSSDEDSDATSVTSIDSEDDFLDARDNDQDAGDGTMITSDMYAPGEHPTELIRQNKRSRGIYTGDDEAAGMSGKTRSVRDPKTGKKKGEKPLSDKQRKKMEAKEAKVKRDEMVGKYLKLLQDGLGDAADMSEIMINALKPPPPYPPMINMARYKLAGAILLPILLATAFVPSWIWARGASATLGFLFFGQPVIDRGIKIFVQKVPNWQDYLDMRNSLLFGVPTNDQLVLHLLRVGERQGVPLPRPPPPPLSGTPKEQIKDNAPDPDDELVDEEGNRIDVDDLGVKDKAMHKSKSKLVGGLKSLSKRVAGIGADVTVDGVKKQVGSKVDRMIWGDMLKDDEDPESYPCRLNGHNGHLVISPMSAYGVPTIAFNTSSLSDKYEWVRDINDIVEIKKAGISVPRAVLGWASGADIESQTLLVRMKSRQDRSASEVDNTVEVKGMNSTEGDSYEFQSVGRREQLFVRLLSMGNQRWESL